MSSSIKVVLVALLSIAPPARGQTTVVARLFDGGSLNGWEGSPGVWRVADGAIIGGTLSKPILQDEFLCTISEFANFELRVAARLKGAGRNGGVSFRGQRVRGSNQVAGYQADIGFIPGQAIASLSDTVPADLDRLYPLWGSLLDEHREVAGRYPNPAQPYRLLAVAPRAIVDRTLRADDWNEIAVSAVGPGIRLQLNGVTTVEFTEKGNVPTAGRVCLQVHKGAALEAWYRDISILPIAVPGD